MFSSVVNRIIPTYQDFETKKGNLIDTEKFMNEFIPKYFNQGTFEEFEFNGVSVEEAQTKVYDMLVEKLHEKRDLVPLEAYQEFMKVILLRTVDKFWMDHIDQMSSLRQSI